MSQPPPDFSDFTMLELFRVEAENQVAVLNAGLLELEREPGVAKPLEALMRAAHSLKGAGYIVSLPTIARVAHAMEDVFVAAQQEEIQLGKSEVDLLLRGVDFFTQVAKTPESEIMNWQTARAGAAADIIAALEKLGSKGDAERVAESLPVAGSNPSDVAPPPPENSGAVLRLTTETVNRLLGLAGESLVESRRLQPLTASMQRLKRLQSEMSTALDGLRQTLAEQPLSERAALQLAEMSGRVAECREFLGGRIEELELFDRRAARISHRLYQETLQVRMRPFGDGVGRFPRMIRDLARSLGKEVRLEITGENTQVDRDILEKLDAPLTHLLRNAVDHGCETPDERRRQNKPPECVVKLEARHSAGMLLVTVADDGRGVDAEKLRAAVSRKKLVTAAVAEKLSEPELLEFLFLPGFTMKEEVTEISGRGVGLDVVRDMVKSVRGKIHVTATPGQGTQFQLQLPITLSVIRALLVKVAGEPYAIPLAQIAHMVKLPWDKVQSLAGRPHFSHGGELIGLVEARQVLECCGRETSAAELAVVVLGDRAARYGLVVDCFLGQRELVVQPLDPRLGKVRDVSAASTMEDGSPVLILDVEDVVRSIEKQVSGGLVGKMESGNGTALIRRRRILVVDDSLTVRELQRKLLVERGYAVAVAVDGQDGWNILQAGEFDLVITDVDMPRLDGLELTAMIRRDARWRKLPVLIVSHKDRAEDRQRGLAAGADEYLAKSGFQEEILLQAVCRLIGEPLK